MSEIVKPRRAASFPRREERARATRQRILDAARGLFIERGYVATTIEAIAETADVAPETVYASFTNKRGILSSLVDIAISGGLGEPPLLEQAWVRSLSAEPDLQRRVRLLARQGRSILQRRAAIDEVVRGAAASDGEIAALRDRSRMQRYAGQRELLRLVVGPSGPHRGPAFDRLADLVYVAGSPETYLLFVVDRGWSGARFERWYAETLDRSVSALTGGSGPQGARRESV